MESVFLFFMMILFFGIIGAIFFKYRHDVRKWLKDPKCGTTWRPSRETYLKRRIEDAEAEIKWLTEGKPDKKSKPGD